MQLILIFQALLLVGGRIAPGVLAQPAAATQKAKQHGGGNTESGKKKRDSGITSRGLTGSGPPCPRGAKKVGGTCKCIRMCPLGSIVKQSLECPLNLKRHCLCKPGYHFKGMKCVKKNRFNPVLPSFGPSVTKPYVSCKGLRRGIQRGLQLLADSILDREVNNEYCAYLGKGITVSTTTTTTREPTFSTALATQLRPTQVPVATEPDGEDGGGEDSFETNNQVKGVDEADVVKSDGRYIFAAYGTELVMMDLNGDVKDRVSPMTSQVSSLLLEPSAQTVTAIGSDVSSQTYVTIYSYKTGTLTQGAALEIPGTYNNARSIKSKAHVITNTYIRTYTLNSVLYRCKIQYRGLSDSAYENLALDYARKTIEELIPEIMEQIGATRRSNCINVAKISTMTDADSDSTETEEDSALDVTGGGGLLQNFIRITSFDISSNIPKNKRTITRSAGAFVPTSNTEVFANSEFVVVAGRGYRRINQGGATNVWAQYTNLISFEFRNNNSRVVAKAVGSVRGYLLNQFSMDFYDGIFRVATTNFRRWGFLNGRWHLVSESSSQVSKLKFDGGRMNLVGQLSELGSTETIFAVRFVGNRGYVVTFRQIDPLFVIDTDPDVPVVLGELKITGFSNFLQQIGENNEYLLGIGKEADEETGRTRGLKISLFDVSDSSDPQEVQSHVVKGFSSSAAQFESKAFRYLPISKKLIIPVRVFSGGIDEDFDGFVVFDIDVVNGINPVSMVTHADNESINNFGHFVCYSSAFLEPRSLVFDGNLVTLKGHTVKYSQGLESLDQQWTVNLDEDRDRSRDDCYFYFGDI